MAVSGTTDRRDRLAELARLCLGDIYSFSKYVIKRPLYPHQVEAVNGIVPYMYNPIPGRQFVIEMARQSGKNELSAQLEAWLMNRHQRTGGQIVKTAPTFKPQVVTSKQRLEDRLGNWWNKGKWKSSMGYMVTLGLCRVLFFSADEQSNVVGATADIALEVDEAQDVDPVKFRKDFSPMASTTDATRIFYGTAWTGDTLLEEMKVANRALERKDGIRRNFHYPWTSLAEVNPAYRRFVEGEIATMGEDHPIIKTQYMLKAIDAEGLFFSPQQIELIRGHHVRCLAPPRTGFTYVAGIDFAGASELGIEDDLLRRAKPRRDSTVLTVGRLDWSITDEIMPWPRLEIMDHYWWTGRNHTETYGTLLHLLRDVWKVSRAVCDNNGVGAGTTSFLKAKLGEIIVPFNFNGKTKSDLGYSLIAAVNTGRYKMYSEQALSPEQTEFWLEAQNAQYEVQGFQRMDWFVPDDLGHDDFLISGALCVEASKLAARPVGVGSIDIPRGRR